VVVDAAELNIFISYRRTDSRGDARSIYDALSRRFGREHVFFDIDSLKPGRDFIDALEETLDRATVMLVIIGPSWLTAADVHGQRRLDDPNDLVRIEVERSLLRGRELLIMPVLVGGAAMPDTDHMPPELRDLTRRQATSLIDEHWDTTLNALIAQLELIGTGLVETPKSGSVNATSATSDGSATLLASQSVSREAIDDGTTERPRSRRRRRALIVAGGVAVVVLAAVVALHANGSTSTSGRGATPAGPTTIVQPRERFAVNVDHAVPGATITATSIGPCPALPTNYTNPSQVSVELREDPSNPNSAVAGSDVTGVGAGGAWTLTFAIDSAARPNRYYILARCEAQRYGGYQGYYDRYVPIAFRVTHG
jgi:hypothetical protein